MSSGRYPLPPVPDGWYAVGASDALGPGEVRPARYFGRELVLFRGHDGAARLFDAHCPHLGAHLGHGGCVEGDGLRCPFHGWRFDGEGRLAEVPRLDRELPRARLRAWPVREAEGRVFAWFHARGAEPGWELPVVRDGDPGLWTDWVTQRWEVRTHVQDMAENILDRAHFIHVHDMEEPDAPRFEISFDGPAMTVEQNMKMENDAAVASRTTNWGPGISLARVDVGPIHSVTFITHTPIESELVEFQLSFSMHRLDDPAATAHVERRNREVTNLQASQDMPIWEHTIASGRSSRRSTARCTTTGAGTRSSTPSSVRASSVRASSSERAGERAGSHEWARAGSRQLGWLKRPWSDCATSWRKAGPDTCTSPSWSPDSR